MRQHSQNFRRILVGNVIFSGKGIPDTIIGYAIGGNMLLYYTIYYKSNPISGQFCGQTYEAIFEAHKTKKT